MFLLVPLVVLAATAAALAGSPVATPGAGGLTHRDARIAQVTGWLLVLAGAGLALLPWFGTAEALRGVEVLVAAVALGLLVATPGLLALVGARTGRPALLLPAAVVLVPLSFLSFAGVLLPLLVPAVLLVRIVTRWSAATLAAGARTVLVGVVGTVQLLTAAACYLALRTERSWHADDGSSGSTSGWVPWGTSLLVIALLVATVVTTATIAGPPRRRPPPAGPRGGA